MKYVFDIETNGLLDTLTTIHCIVLINIETEELLSFRPTEVDKAIKLLSEAKLICGHNIINFDLPAIKKLNPGFETKAKIVDTMICSRLIWSDIKNTDYYNCLSVVYQNDDKIFIGVGTKKNDNFNYISGVNGQPIEITNKIEEIKHIFPVDVIFSPLA